MTYSVHRQSLGRLAGLALAVAAGFFVSGASVSYASETPASASTTGTTRLAVGQAEVLRFEGLSRVVVADGRLVTAQPLADGSVVLVGKQPGQTSLLIWAKGMQGVRQLVEVESVAAKRMQGEVRRAVGDSKSVQVLPVGDQLVVSGQADSSEQASRLKAIAERNAKLVNLVRAEGTEPMIAMEVRFLEVKKNALENVGIQWQKSMAGPMVGLVGDFRTNSQFRPTSDGLLTDGQPNISANFPGLDSAANSPRVSPFAMYFGMQSTLMSVINFMEQSGDAVVLAEPILSTRSGGVAKFLAGGEIPLPVTSSLGSSTVQFKPYGIRFEIAPLVTEAGVISATVTTELSTVDPAIRVGELPGFLSRMTETQVNLREGETLVMSGLISEEVSRLNDQVKGLGSIPVLGALFRSKDFQDRRSEMVVMVTPRLIQPNDAFHRQKEAWAQDHKAKRGMRGIDIKSKSQDTPSLNQDEQAQEVRHD